jgi:hypothetical protein
VFKNDISGLAHRWKFRLDVMPHLVWAVIRAGAVAESGSV